jgi:hypothetical protein
MMTEEHIMNLLTVHREWMEAERKNFIIAVTILYN